VLPTFSVKRGLANKRVFGKFVDDVVVWVYQQIHQTFPLFLRLGFLFLWLLFLFVCYGVDVLFEVVCRNSFAFGVLKLTFRTLPVNCKRFETRFKHTDMACVDAVLSKSIRVGPLRTTTRHRQDDATSINGVKPLIYTCLKMAYSKAQQNVSACRVVVGSDPAYHCI
jgi:hypothetical protein